MTAWKTARLREIAAIERNSVEPGQIAGGTLYVGLENIDSDGCFVGVRAVGPGELASNKFSFSKNHILYGKLRPYLAKIGRPRFDGICSTDILPILPNPDVSKDYLLHVLRQPTLIKEAASLCTGANLPRLSPSILAEFRVPLPPLHEQRRIANILDKADALRTKRREALATLDGLTQAIFLQMFGHPVLNGKGLPRAVLGDVAAFVGGGTPSRAVADYFSGSICWATPKDMKHDYLENTQEHITERAIRESATNLVPANTILVVVKSKVLAHHLPVAVSRVPTCFGQDLKGIVINANADVSFVATALRIGKKWLLDRARGANTEGLTVDHLKRFPLPLPKLSEQLEFARRARAVDRLKELFTASVSQLDTLFAGLQHRAFRGEL